MRTDVGYNSLLFGVELLEHDDIWRSKAHRWDQLGYVAPEHVDGEYDTDTKGFDGIGGHDRLESELEMDHVDGDLSELQ